MANGGRFRRDTLMGEEKIGTPHSLIGGIVSTLSVRCMLVNTPGPWMVIYAGVCVFLSSSTRSYLLSGEARVYMRKCVITHLRTQWTCALMQAHTRVKHSSVVNFGILWAIQGLLVVSNLGSSMEDNRARTHSEILCPRSCRLCRWDHEYFTLLISRTWMSVCVRSPEGPGNGNGVNRGDTNSQITHHRFWEQVLWSKSRMQRAAHWSWDRPYTCALVQYSSRLYPLLH